jgi:hypothetical protein
MAPPEAIPSTGALPHLRTIFSSIRHCLNLPKCPVLRDEDVPPLAKLTSAERLTANW